MVLIRVGTCLLHCLLLNKRETAMSFVVYMIITILTNYNNTSITKLQSHTAMTPHITINKLRLHITHKLHGHHILAVGGTVCTICTVFRGVGNPHRAT